MFGRKRKQEEAAAEASREAERHALFAQLATRPDDVCPFLGLADDRVGFRDEANPEHRCYAFGDPAPLSGDQQTKVCLDRGYGNCPRYLRGVLVIPTEELEALRRPAPPRAPESATPPPPRRRRPVAAWLIGLLLLVLVAGSAGAVFLTGGLGPLANNPTPTATPSASLPATAEPSATATTTGTPAPPTASPTPELTPAPSDAFIGYEVEVAPGEYTLFDVDDAGDVIASRPGEFDAQSRAGVERIEAPNGLLHWRTQGGGYDGLSYIRDRSGPFLIREVYEGGDGSLRYIRLSPEES